MKLTLPQRDIYFEQLLYPGEPIYNIGAKIGIKGPLDLKCIKAAYVRLIDQHDAFRSVLVAQDEDAAMRVVETHDTELGFVDFSGSAYPLELAEDYMQKNFLKPFDLSAGTLLHVFTLVKVREDFHYLFSVYHHIITDGWGTSLMFQRLVQNYNEILQYGAVVTGYPYPYADFAEDDRTYEYSDEYLSDKKYWTERFRSLPDCPFDTIDEQVKANKSKRKKLVIPRAQYNELEALARRYKCSVFHILLATLFTYFGKKHDKQDLAIGLPVLNRGKAAFKKTVGLFMGMSPLRCTVDFDDTFVALLEQVRTQLRQDYRHQRFPLGKLVQALRTYGSQEKLFYITMSYEKQDYSIDFLHTATRVIPLTHQSERAALAIYVREFDAQQDVEIDFDYGLKYFDEESITAVTGHIANLLESILVAPEERLLALQYLGQQERTQLLETFNATPALVMERPTVTGLFAEQAQRYPGALAVKDDTVAYTYAELDQLSDRIAVYFAPGAGEHPAPVAVMTGRSAGLLAMLLGILKSGRAYIPLDPSFPAARLNYILEDSGVSVLVTEQARFTDDLSAAATIIPYEHLLALPAGEAQAGLPEPDPAATAYIIYTSGSTGNPKGVVIGHKALCNFLCSMRAAPGFAPGDLLFSVTTYSFDISILEFFVPLVSGASVYMASQAILSDPDLVLQRLSELQPTVMQATPGFYQMLFHAGWTGNANLRLLCGGDLLSRSLADKLVDSAPVVWNMYGPTETTIWSSKHQVRHGGDASCIGRPIHNTKMYVLDAYRQLKPLGVPGTIYIAGDGLAKGYLDRPELTAEKFVPNPFEPGTLMYDTGDLGYWRPDGCIGFLGRKDHQVKVRGYRIELGEIETQLNRLPGIAAAVTVARKGREQEASLVAYVQWKAMVTPFAEPDMMRVLQERLPHYMIPSRIVTVTAFPLTPNGKIDRKALAEQELKSDAVAAQPLTLSDLELKLLGYWREVLDYESEIGMQDNFFALGGHSLNAVRLVKLIRQNLAVDVALGTVFAYPTVSLLAEHLQRSDVRPHDTVAIQEEKDCYELTAPQYHIWLAAQHESVSIGYNMAAAYRVAGTIDPGKITGAVNEIIARYEILRTNFMEVDGKPRQKVSGFEPARLALTIVDATAESTGEQVAALISRPFDLKQDLLLRIWLLRTPGGSDVLLFCTHHIIMDGLSLEIFIREFVANYNGKGGVQDPLPFQFKDYTAWANRIFSENQKVNRPFWHAYLQHYTTWNLLSAYNRSASSRHRRGTFAFALPAGATAGLKNIAATEQVTFFTLLTAAFNVMLHRFLGHTDLCIGTVNAARNATGLDEQIGMFVKTLILRTRIDEAQPFTELMHRVQAGLLQIDMHQDIDSGIISAAVFDILFAFQNPDFSHNSVIGLEGAALHALPVDLAYTKLPVVFNVFEQEQELKGLIEFDSDLFDAGFMELLALKYCKILAEIEKEPFVPVAAVDDKLEEETDIPAGLDFDFNF